MLDALLATIGTLGVLASLVARRGHAVPGGDALASDSQDGQDRPCAATPGGRRRCRQRRPQSRLSRETGR